MRTRVGANVDEAREPRLDAYERGHLRRLGALLEIAGRVGPRRLTAEQLEDLPRLYRFASSVLARLETTGEDPAATARVRQLVLRSHGLLHREASGADAPLLARALRYYLVDVPRAVRAEWRLLLASAGVFYGLAIAAFVLVTEDLTTAYALLDPDVVDREVAQLDALAAGEPFRGNFTFGREESAATAGQLMAHNVGVSLLFFGSALIPPLYLVILTSNALMLGAYTGVPWHWGQAGEISSILWCHGTLELQAIILAGTAGLVLARGWIAPGPWSRAEAARRARSRALAVLAAMAPMLVAAGFVEGFVSPHADLVTRLATAVASAAVLVLWLGLSGRGRRAARYG